MSNDSELEISSNSQGSLYSFMHIYPWKNMNPHLLLSAMTQSVGVVSGNHY